MIATEIAAESIEKYGDALLADIPCRRFGTPEDLGKVLVFLASDAAGYMNGCPFRAACLVFCLEYSSWRYTDDLNDAGECFTEKRLVLVVPYAFCVGVVLFCQISQPAPVPSPRRSIWLDRAVDVRQSLFYNSGKVLRLGVDVCHLRQGFPLPETETLRRPVPSCRR